MDQDLQQLLDERDIARLCLRYASALDDRDWPRLRTVFTPDAVAEYDGIDRCDGYDAIEQLCRTALSPLTRSQHLLANVQPLVSRDEATCTCYLQAQHVRSGTAGGENFIIAGRYTDRVVRTGDGWRIAHRRLETWWTEGNPAVVGR